ncbi:hypothetical protein NADFUDRAFT_46359 [Nadsonia fulvescens var. elongata DSM 6958]|uniref:Sphingolipid delta(4)-desaturase n=1 Tax=Nadsonia fulvescens var. elongata DSM 6958 TaxID=857566 RepID=A0A1E3PJT9_9ASCO|nr:hypothetical protein NADFUDRAFT_46359 [Nadsonia fulvescens var. elongata DSM 6958]
MATADTTGLGRSTNKDIYLPESSSQIAEKPVVEQQEELGNPNSFLWTFQEEPHRSRRRAIVKAHPEVTKLCGHEPLTKYVIFFVVGLQFLCAYLLRNTPFLSWKFFLVAYIIGATCSQNVFLAIHEMSHNLAFKKPLHNKLFSIFTNLPIGVPYSAGFGPYHLLHHKHLGDAKYDTDLPTNIEAVFLSNVAGKAFFATFQLLFYAIRPICVAQLPFTYIHFLNIVTIILADVALVHFWGKNALFYFLLSSFLAGSLHPLAGHFIAEHYVMERPEVHSKTGIAAPETFSYYGILNFFVYNVGLHNEHHDFPFVPWTRLHKLNEIAKEFYDPLPSHTSWSMVIVNFVFDPKVSLWCRVKREKSARDVTDTPETAGN